MTGDEVEAWLARTRTADRDHRLPHDADRTSLRTRLRDRLDALGVAPADRDAVVELCAAEMSRLFSAHAATSAASEAPSNAPPAAPEPVDGPRPVRVDAPAPASASRSASAHPPASASASSVAAPATATMPAPSIAAPVAPHAGAPTVDATRERGRDPRTGVLGRTWFRSQWRRLHWSGRVALVLLGPPAALVLGLMALCTVSPPVGATVLGTTNRVFDGELYGHDFVGFGKGRYETSPWQFTFLHPRRAAMDGLRTRCEREPGFAPSVCATVEHAYRLEQRGSGYTKVVDADNEQAWFEREACPALAVLDHRLYAKNLDAGWERYRSHGCVPYDA